MKVSKATIQKIIKEELAKIIKEEFQASSDDSPRKVNNMRVQDLKSKVDRNGTDIDQLFELITEHVLTPKGISVPRAAANK